jgi:hypothetical protein
MRRYVKKSVDRRIFRKTANRTKKLNIVGHGVKRGGREF